jgi:hypothetical protein
VSGGGCEAGFEADMTETWEGEKKKERKRGGRESLLGL